MLLLIRAVCDVGWDDLEARNFCAKAILASVSLECPVWFHFGCAVLMAGPIARDSEYKCYC